MLVVEVADGRTVPADFGRVCVLDAEPPFEPVYMA